MSQGDTDMQLGGGSAKDCPAVSNVLLILEKSLEIIGINVPTGVEHRTVFWQSRFRQ